MDGWIGWVKENDEIDFEKLTSKIHVDSLLNIENLEDLMLRINLNKRWPLDDLTTEVIKEGKVRKKVPWFNKETKSQKAVSSCWERIWHNAGHHASGLHLSQQCQNIGNIEQVYGCYYLWLG